MRFYDYTNELLNIGGTGVEFVREELKEIIKNYELIFDVLQGEHYIKEKKIKYLPRPNAQDVSDENVYRYTIYLHRAVFYNVTKRTLDGMVGEVFSVDPLLEIPAELEKTVLDVTGSGINLQQLAKKALANVMAYGRSGIFTDYPRTDSAVSQQQLNDGIIRPTMSIYNPWQIINWSTIVRGAKTLLNLVVLSDMQAEVINDFETKYIRIYRVLQLINDVYTISIYSKSEDQTSWNITTFVPTDASGNIIDEIPFTFIGSEDNSATISNPPIYDIASLNIAHFRDSADYQESCYLVGQPTPVIIGLTEDWVKNVLKGRVPLGSRAAIALPIGADAKLLQAAPNTMPFEAMQHKERQMSALGAKLVEQREVQRTATEAGQENAAQSSILSTAAKNVSQALKWSLEWCAVFVGIGDLDGEGAGINFELNTDFTITDINADDRTQVIGYWQSNAITFSEMRECLHKSGIATEDDEKAKAEIEGEMAKAMQATVDQTKEINSASE